MPVKLTERRMEVDKPSTCGGLNKCAHLYVVVKIKKKKGDKKERKMVA